MKKIILTILTSLFMTSCLVDVDPYGVDYLLHSDVYGDTWDVPTIYVEQISKMKIEYYNGTTLKIIDSIDAGNVKVYRAKLDTSSSGGNILQYEVMLWTQNMETSNHYLNFDRLSPSKMYIMTNYYNILNDRGYTGPRTLTLTKY